MAIRKNVMKKIKRALISLSDKRDLKPLLKILRENKIEIISSGGTYKKITKLKYKCIEVAKYTGFSEILDGRVKTLHPKIHAGILNKRNKKSHIQDLKKNNFKNIDLVIVNFYPFEETLKKTLNHKKIIENIDIGGPSMARSAAKNYNDVTVITSTDQYDELINELKKNKGKTSLKFRKKMSQHAFMETAYYDTSISNYFNEINQIQFPKKKIIHGNLINKFRYGENPHQTGSIYSKNKDLGIKQLNGKDLSYNNYNDIFSALTISKTFPKNIGTVIIKHSTPSGASILKKNIESYKAALACDPISAFGGIVSCNFKINKELATELSKIFLEVIIGIGFDKDALKIFKKKRNLRLIDASDFKLNDYVKFNSFNGLIMAQSEDKEIFKKKNFKIVSKKKPSKSQFEDLLFAFNICRFVKSNSIVLVRNKSTIGIGSGQPSRLDSCEIAINKMKKFSKSNQKIAAASDAFFPFVDGVEKIIQSGVTSIIQPSGSIRDKDIIKFTNETNTVLVFSKTRHFRH